MRPFQLSVPRSFILSASPVRGCECVGDKPQLLGPALAFAQRSTPSQQPQNPGPDQPVTPSSAEPSWDLHSSGWPQADPNQRTHTRREDSRKWGLALVTKGAQSEWVGHTGFWPIRMSSAVQHLPFSCWFRSGRGARTAGASQGATAIYFSILTTWVGSSLVV